MKRTILLLTFVVTVSCMHAQRMLTLEECRNLAIQNNKELQISGEKIKMADNEKKAAFTKYFPQLSANGAYMCCLLYTSPSPRDVEESRMPSSA